MYESIEQKKPKYEAKGIETVRRDGCPAVSKVFNFHFKLYLKFYHQNIFKIKYTVVIIGTVCYFILNKLCKKLFF